MSTLSTSFTLGKASVQHGANLKHNNREFIAKNINVAKLSENVTYVKKDVKESYQQLFGKSIEEYNQKQKQPCRRINDYYEHIANGKREEAFYEIVVQFGDSKTAPCGSPNGELAKTMLDEYIKGFEKRNPNLHIFNAVLHMDEASPHLHINFIPFYTQGRKNGLQKGVSMKAALDEQGFSAKNFKENRLVAWEESERAEMEKLLHKHGFKREDKNAKYAHQTVEEYKKAQDEKKIITALRNIKNVSGEEVSKENIRRLKSKLNILENENETLVMQKHSPYKSFYYSSPDKQSYVQARLDELDIPYRETENGFEAQECYVDKIRKIEKEFKPPRSAAREKLREDIDRLLMQSNDIDELIEKLKKERYIIKTGKYIAVKPANGQQYIRLKSLGEQYSEYALRNRIKAHKKYESDLQQKINSATNKDSIEFFVMKTMQLYTIAFKRGALPVRKINSRKPLSWINDRELDRLLALNKKINEGATLESMKIEFEQAENAVAEKEKNIEKSRNDLRTFQELKEKIQIVFEGKSSDRFTRQQADQTLRNYPNITASNYMNVDILINNEVENVDRIESELNNAREKLKQAADDFSAMEKICGGTYVQSLVGEERQRRESDFIPNGLKKS